LGALPSHGWTASWVGRRDRALLVPSHLAGPSVRCPRSAQRTGMAAVIARVIPCWFNYCLCPGWSGTAPFIGVASRARTALADPAPGTRLDMSARTASGQPVSAVWTTSALSAGD